MISAQDPGFRVLLLLEREGSLSGARIGSVVWRGSAASRCDSGARGRLSRIANRALHRLAERGLVSHDVERGTYALAPGGRAELALVRAQPRPLAVPA